MECTYGGASWPPPVEKGVYIAPPAYPQMLREAAVEVEDWDNGCQTVGELNVIYAWMGDMPEFDAPNIFVEEFAGFNHGEIVPRYWLPDTIEELSPQEWWDEHTKLATYRYNYPDCDFKPFWVRYMKPDSCFIRLPIHPKTVMERSDPEYFKVAREHNMMLHIDPMNQWWKREKLNNKDKTRRDRAAAHALGRIVDSNDIQHSFHPSAVTTKLGITLRRGAGADLAQMLWMWNNDIENGVHCLDTSARSFEDIRSRIINVYKAGLPCIVAVASFDKEDLFNENKVISVPELVGFIVAEPYNDFTGLYANTASLSIFVREKDRSCGVGSCLLDSMLSWLHPGYSMRGGYGWVGEEPFDINTPRKEISTIIATVPYDCTEKSSITTVRKWLGREFGFKRAANLSEVGVAKGKWLSLDIFQMKTTANVGIPRVARS